MNPIVFKFYTEIIDNQKNKLRLILSLLQLPAPPAGEDNTLFVELFDEEYKEFLKRRPTNIAHLMSDECMLLGPVYTPLTGNCTVEQLTIYLYVYFKFKSF